MALDGNEIGAGTQITVGLGSVAAIAFALGKWLFGSSAKSIEELKSAQDAQAKAILAKLDNVVALQGSHSTALAVSNAEVAQLKARIERLEDENQKNRDERHRVAQLQSDSLKALADAVKSLPAAAREGR